MRTLRNFLGRKLNDIRLKQKLILLYSVCGLLPALILSVILLIGTHDRLLSLTNSQIYSDNQANRSTLSAVTNMAHAVSKILSSDERLSYLISTEFETEEDVFTAYREFSLPDDFTHNYAEIADIKVYIDNPSLVASNRYQLIDVSTRGASWYQALEKSNSDSCWVYDSSLSHDAHLHLIKEVIVPQTKQYAILIISVSDNYLSSINTNRQQTTYISLENGPIFFSTTKERIGQTLVLDIIKSYKDRIASLYQYERDEVLAYESTLKSVSSIQTFHITTISYDNERIEQILTMIGFITLFVAMVPFLLFFFFSDNYSQRLLTIRSHMHEISQGKLQLKDDFTSKDELGELFEDMKATIDGIQKLHLQILTEQKEKDKIALRQQQMQFELLASQINPHFLFNTLETIRMHALLEGQVELNSIILKLGQTLRYALDAPSSITTLESALEYLQSYLEIQHFRFQDKLNYEIHIQPGLEPRKTLMLPFLLQPIVENAVIHGFSTKKKGGKIIIDVLRKENNVIIRITDNGQGISPEHLEELSLRLSKTGDEVSTAHIGMANVNDRIKLHYGASYGLSISSQLDVGTTVTIQIPYNEV